MGTRFRSFGALLTTQLCCASATAQMDHDAHNESDLDAQ